MNRFVVVFIMLFWSAIAISAEPKVYLFDETASEINFIYRLNGNPVIGRVPVLDAQVRLDFGNLAASTIVIVMNMSKVRAGIFIATEAIKSESILNTADFPQAVFVARKIVKTTGGAEITGNLTLRDVTRSLVMKVRFYRQSGTRPEDRSRLVLSVQGGFSRREFGVTGYSGLVGDRIDLDILVYVNRR